MIVAEEDTSATIFLIFFHNHPENPLISFRYVRRQICFLSYF